jgi:hypothetical protein
LSADVVYFSGGIFYVGCRSVSNIIANRGNYKIVRCIDGRDAEDAIQEVSVSDETASNSPPTYSSLNIAALANADSPPTYDEALEFNRLNEVLASIANDTEVNTRSSV